MKIWHTIRYEDALDILRGICKVNVALAKAHGVESVRPVLQTLTRPLIEALIALSRQSHSSNRDAEQKLIGIFFIRQLC